VRSQTHRALNRLRQLAPELDVERRDTEDRDTDRAEEWVP
jgi:hypothetical protein